jgi:N-acetylglucosaminyl-diphospho-decaprenol L-rhamnosyltransferase
MGLMPFSDLTIGLMILNRNGKQWLSPLYESIRRNRYPRTRVYLVDNLSDDGSVELTLSEHPDVTVIRMPQNLGFVMAYNLAMSRAFEDGCAWVIWANNDILLEPGCLGDLARAAKSDPSIGIVGPAFLSWDGEGPNYYMKGKHPDLIPAMQARSCCPIDVDWVEGSFLMVHRDTIESVGPLDPCFFIFWEEAEFCRRVRFAGKRVVLVPSALVRHYGGAFSAGRRDSRRQWLHSRNYYIYKLIDPEHTFAHNILTSAHLFAANLKSRIRNSPRGALLELFAYGSVSATIARWYRKWRNARNHIPPQPLEKKYRGIQPEILLSVSREASNAK